MYLIYDKTGFPYITFKEWDFYISLFPVFKNQYEYFLSESNLDNEKYYKDALLLNGRTFFSNINKPQKLFITGLNPEGINKFLEYLGDGYRLPNYEEWIKLYNKNEYIKQYKKEIIKIILNKKEKYIFLNYWIKNLDFPLVNGSVFELLNDKQQVINKPFYNWLNNMWDSNSLKPIFEKQKDYIGYRIVKNK